MATTPATPTPPAAQEVLSAEELVAGLIKTMPSLTAIKDQVSLVAAVLTWKKLNFSPAETLAQIEAFQGVKLPAIQNALAAMKRAAMVEATAIAVDFKSLTDATLDPATLNITPRTQSEIEEQARYKQAALDLRARVTTIVMALSTSEVMVRDLWAEGQTRRAAKKNAVEVWREKALAALALIPGAVQEIEPDPETLKALPGWKTLPVLNPQLPEVKHLLTQVSMIETMIKRLKAPTTILAQLKNSGVTIEALEAILLKASELAHGQIVQSDTIDVLSKRDQAKFVVRITGYTSVSAVQSEAEEFIA